MHLLSLVQARARLSAVKQHRRLSQFGTEGLDDGFIGLVGVHPSHDAVPQPAEFLAELGLTLAEIGEDCLMHGEIMRRPVSPEDH